MSEERALPLPERLIRCKAGGRVHPGLNFREKVEAGAAHIAAPGHGILLYNGRCQHPITMRVTAQDGLPEALGPAPRGTFDTVVRCRKCDACRRYKRVQWVERAKAEMVQSKRTWFGTLTVAPVFRYQLQLKAGAAYGPGFGPGHEQFFAATFSELGREVQLWLKRSRKAAGVDTRLRFMLAAEQHSDGFPHVHVLVHEVEGTITYRELRAGWKMGFSQFSIVREPAKAAHYAAKYITKGSGARLRASLRYGAWRMAQRPVA